MAHLPEKLGTYDIRRRLGAGAMGVVYLAWDGRLNRQVAIKTLWPELALENEARERFLREARAAAAISHPNVTQIYDIGEDAGDVFFAMEFVDGRSLAQLLEEEGQLPVDFALSVVRQAATGLKAAAERGIIHRDIKPANLVLTADGVLKITDFGLAKQPATDSNLTTAGLVIGTPHYLSPEQATGEPTDVRSDIYSLGATLYELLTGRPPFEGDNPVSVILKHAREPVPSPARLRPGLPPGVSNLLQRMLAKRPEGRPQDHDELIRHLDRLLADCSQTLAAQRPTAVTTTAPSRRGVPVSAVSPGVPMSPALPGVPVSPAAPGVPVSRALPGVPVPPAAPGVSVSVVTGSSIPLVPAIPSPPAVPVPMTRRQVSGASTPLIDRAAAPPAPEPTPGIGSRLLVVAFVGLGALVLWGLVREHLPAVTSSPIDLTVPAPVTDHAGEAHSTGPATPSLGTDTDPSAGIRTGAPATSGLIGPRRADLAIMAKTHEITADGLLRVAGQVTNQGRSRATGSRIEITLTDNKTGNKMHSVEVPVIPARLGPGETGEFEAFFPDPRKSVHIGLELSWVS